MGSIRDLVYNISPPWLQHVIANKFLYVPGLGIDLLCEKRDQGNLLAMPGYGDPSGLAYIGRDRVITRGLVESDDSYAIRLQQAWDDWGFAGSPRSVLRQTLTYILPDQPEALTVNDSGNWDVYIADADTTQPPTHYYVNPTNWDWDGSTKWWRCFLIFFSISPDNFTDDEGTWGDGALWGDDTASWGISVPPTVITSMRAILSQWKAQHAWFEWMIISFDASWFQPWLAAGDPNLPDGTWGHWGTVNVIAGARVYQRSRTVNARYCDGAL